ncbi:MAG: NF038122 family metalloprotease [Limisphaerales bacterium]
MKQIPEFLQFVLKIGRFIKSCCRLRWALCAGSVAVALTVLPSPARAMVINVTYDSSVTSQANAAQIEAAYNLVVANFETLYTNPITVNITVNWGQSGFGSSSTVLYQGYQYSDLTAALQNAETTPEDRSAVASLPSSDPTGSDNWLMPRAELKNFPVLASETGVDPNDSQNDGSVYFASNGVTWTFGPLNRAVSGEYDFMAVAEHETSEAMGRIWALNLNPGPGDGYLPYDLFRFTNGVRTFNPFDSGVYFSVNNGVTALKPFNAVTELNYTSEDAQDWMPTNLPDAYDWEISDGVKGILSSADLTSLDILGYDLNFTPPKLTGTRLSNGNFEITFTNVTGLGFTVWASTNILSPGTNWANLGAPTETAVGHYQFIDNSARKNRFYRVLLQ